MAQLELLEVESSATFDEMVASFFRPKFREPLLRVLPLALLLLAQALLAARLHNTADRDEGLYIYTGHQEFARWFHGTPIFTHPERYFPGAPQIYPVLAAMLDRVGGLQLVRAFSNLFMLTVTASLYFTTRRLFSRKTAVLAAFAFALAGPTLYLGNYASFDALGLACLAGGTALGVKAAQQDSYRWVAPSGLLLALGGMTSYAVLPFLVAAVLLIAISAPRRQALTQAGLIGAVSAVTLGLAAVFLLRSELEGVRSTFDPSVNNPGSYLDIAWLALRTDGVWIALSVLGAVLLARLRRWGLVALLLLTTLAPLLYQAQEHELDSLDKYLGYGLWFGAPLIGFALYQMVGTFLRRVTFIVSVVLITVLGLQSSHYMYTRWADASSLFKVMASSIASDCYIRTLGDEREQFRYNFSDKTEYWQWDSTDPSAIYYDGKRGLEAARAGLNDRYWQFVYFDSSTYISRDLAPLMTTLYGYAQTKTVILHTRSGTQTWQIFENYGTPLGHALKLRNDALVTPNRPRDRRC